ncbi:GNAT family N-acetyltransferase [Nocardia sp. NBC_01009]|uniref:GNAT family N-acetyltransferase n=1 Tax=Nocardia sp. NBC_01009 TaxID=2975996 RepID=UPI00386FBCA3|nr:GNAT family N-acetyltransferase [Nocardia sp. NBC_01009]
MSRHFSTADSDLITDRLMLRSWTADEVAAVLDGRRLAHWAEDFPAEGDRVIVSLVAEHPGWLTEYGHRQIIECETGLVVGSLGLFWPPVDGALEIGYGVVGSRQGRGYATESTSALAEFALTTTEVHTVYANVELSNPASIRVLEKAGFQHWGTADDKARFRIIAAD